MAKVVILALTCEVEPWRRVEHCGIRAAWGAIVCPDVKIYYSHASGSQPQTYLSGDRIYAPFRESLDNIGRKTVAALQWVLENEPFDYLFRVNT